MGQCIVKLEGRYLLWSSITDSPVSMGMTLEELQQHVLEEDGQRGLRALGARLKRVEAKGTSSFDDDSALETVWLNRAGHRSTCMTVEQIAEYYVRQRDWDAPRPTGANTKVTIEAADPTGLLAGGGRG